MRQIEIPFDRVLGRTSEATPEEKATCEKFKRFLEHIRIRPSDRFVYPPEILTVDEITIATVGNFSASVGKPKSRKTFNVSAIVAALLSGERVLNYKAKLPVGKGKVLYVDTEQSRVHCHKVLERILRLAGLPTDREDKRLEFLMLREFTPHERRDILDMTLATDGSIGFVVIDGIRDMISDINSPGESVDIINDLMRWTNVYNLHIHTVLHLNKSDDNTRGHIGTELNNKAETVLKITKSKDMPSVSEVRPMITREREFERFAFQVTSDGIPEIVEDYDGENEKLLFEEISVAQHRTVMENVFAGNAVVMYGTLMESLMREYAAIGYKRGRTRFVGIIKLLVNAEVIEKQDRGYVCRLENVERIKK